MQRKWLTRILAGLMMLTLPLAAACGTPAATGAPPAATSATVSAAPSAGASSAPTPVENDLPLVELDWYLGLNPMPDAQMVNDALNEYLLEKINTKVNLFYWTSADWESKMTTMVSSGQDVGVIGFGSQSKLDYVIQSTRGAFAPMEDLLDRYGTGTKALFDREIWDCMTINGHIYGIPSLKDNCYIMSFIYNVEMAEALGIDMDSFTYSNWRSAEDFLTDVVAKRHEVFPEYDEYPLCGGVSLDFPYNFAVESFLNDSFLAVCNIEGIMDVAAYDPETVFNLYGTDEYRAYARGRVRMVEKNIQAYDYTGKDDWPYSGALFGFLGWGYTYMEEHLYGDAFTTKMVVSDRIWTDTNNYFSAGTAISANCANPERAMMLLELVNTDPAVATMMRFGVEGQHYVINDQGKMQFEGSARNGGARADYGYYYWYAAPVGNLTIVNAPESLVGPDSIMLTRMAQYNIDATKPNHMGFVVNMEPITNEIAACTNVVMEYRDTIRNGQYADEAAVDAALDEFNAKLTANGAEKIVSEIQTQIDAWKAAR